MLAPQANQPDLKGTFAALAQESQLPVDDLVKLYEHEREELATRASITAFLHIFAMRNVKEILRKRSSDNAQRH